MGKLLDVDWHHRLLCLLKGIMRLVTLLKVGHFVCFVRLGHRIAPQTQQHQLKEREREKKRCL